jgi:hypothetical protein
MLVFFLVGFFTALVSIGEQEVHAQEQREPIVIISPDCGPSSGFNIYFDANGFTPNGSVHWEFVSSDGLELVGPFGMFATNSTGGFNEVTNTEEQSPDVYTLRFFDDIDNDGRPDESGARFSTNVSMPCLQYSNNNETVKDG